MRNIVGFSQVFDDILGQVHHNYSVKEYSFSRALRILNCEALAPSILLFYLPTLSYLIPHIALSKIQLIPRPRDAFS